MTDRPRLKRRKQVRPVITEECRTLALREAGHLELGLSAYVNRAIQNQASRDERARNHAEDDLTVAQLAREIAPGDDPIQRMDDEDATAEAARWLRDEEIDEKGRQQLVKAFHAEGRRMGIVSPFGGMPSGDFIGNDADSATVIGENRGK